MRRLLIYLLMAAVLWLCGRIASGQPPGRRLPVCTDRAAVDASVTRACQAMRRNAETWESLRDELWRLLEEERETTRLTERVYDQRKGHRRENQAGHLETTGGHGLVVEAHHGAR